MPSLKIHCADVPEDHVVATVDHDVVLLTTVESDTAVASVALDVDSVRALTAHLCEFLALQEAPTERPSALSWLDETRTRVEAAEATSFHSILASQTAQRAEAAAQRIAESLRAPRRPSLRVVPTFRPGDVAFYSNPADPMLVRIVRGPDDEGAYLVRPKGSDFWAYEFYADPADLVTVSVGE